MAGVNPDQSPEERAHRDALADAVEMGVYGEDALRYADQMRGTLWFQSRVLHHAGIDIAAAYRKAGRDIVSRVRAFFRTHDCPPPTPEG